MCKEKHPLVKSSQLLRFEDVFKVLGIQDSFIPTWNCLCGSREEPRKSLGYT